MFGIHHRREKKTLDFHNCAMKTRVDVTHAMVDFDMEVW